MGHDADSIRYQDANFISAHTIERKMARLRYLRAMARSGPDLAICNRV